MLYRATVPADVAEIAARDFCYRYLHLSHRLWKRLKWQGETKVNGEKVIPAVTTLRAGDELVCWLPETNNLLPAPADAALPALDIIYEDDYILVINKPANLLVHPAPKERVSLLGAAVLATCKAQGREAIFHPAHRLDRNTSGLLAIAYQPQVQNLLLQNGTKLFRRRYLAIIYGKMAALDGTIDLPLGPKDGSRIEQCVRPDGKRAVTNYQTVAIADIGCFMPNGRNICLSQAPPAGRADPAPTREASKKQSAAGETNPPAAPNYVGNIVSLLEISLETGRTHQIRAHFSHLGHPLVGDDLYGPPRPPDCPISRQTLHAWKLAIDLPWAKSGRDQTLSLAAPPPPDLALLVRHCLAGEIINPALAAEIADMLPEYI